MRGLESNEARGLVPKTSRLAPLRHLFGTHLFGTIREERSPGQTMNEMAITWFRWLVGTPLVALGIGIALWNWSAIFLQLMHPRGPYPSWIPLIGGLLGSVGLAVLPDERFDQSWWLPLLVDWGSVPGLAATGIFYLWKFARRRSPGNRAEPES